MSDLNVAKRSQRADGGSGGPPRQASERKVSEGLIQLLPDAYRFVRESFLLLDSEASGDVSRETLKHMLTSLGMRASDARLDEMLARTGEPLNFAAYLAVMSEIFQHMPEESELAAMFDAFKRSDGSLDAPALTGALREQGLADSDIDAVFNRYSKITANGRAFDVNAFVASVSIPGSS